jgi:hypothetical protein
MVRLLVGISVFCCERTADKPRVLQTLSFDIPCPFKWVEIPKKKPDQDPIF